MASSRLRKISQQLGGAPGPAGFMLAEAPLEGQVALVTGASRGIGKGCALALAKAGATVYITGRTITASDTRPGTLAGAAAEINDATKDSQGSCVPVVCDHADDASVEGVFDQIAAEHGRLDVLVNNCYDGGKMSGKWWENDAADAWDRPVTVGLRSMYVASMFAARMMAPKKAGLIVNISAFGGIKPYTSVVYTTVKTGIDRFTADAALELLDDNVSMVSIWPGLVKTEGVINRMGGPEGRVAKSKNAESPEFVGLGVVALATDPETIHTASGKVIMAWELAEKYDYVDPASGVVPQDKVMRGLKAEMAGPPPHWDLDRPLDPSQMIRR